MDVASHARWGARHSTSSLIPIALIVVLAFASMPAISWRAGGEPRALRLDVRPFTDPSATFVHLQTSGAATVVRYSASALFVTAAYEGQLPQTETKRLMTTAGGPELRRAQSTSWRGSSGLEQGDLYELRVDFGDASQKVNGFRHTAPDAIDALIEELMALDERLQATSAPEAYLRAEPLPARQLAAIRERGTLHLASLEQVPAPSRSVAQSALGRPSEFHPISRHQYRDIVAVANHGGELLIDFKGEGFKLSPFEARNVSVQHSDE